MAEGRKRSRKSKLEVRSDVECDETEKTILQNLPLLIRPEMESMFLDHSYSRQNSSPAQTPIELTVKVEVEEVDESMMDASKKNSFMRSLPTDGLKGPGSRKINTPIQFFHVNLENMYKISELISWSSTNPADKYFNIEMRNSWGRIFRAEDDSDPYNLLIQKALNAWGLALINGRYWRECPLFYQCHICDLAWWHLHPFREHIKKQHDHKNLKVYHQENMHESIIVANYYCSTIIKYIPLLGNCYRCGFNYEFHVRTSEKQYTCTECFTKACTCWAFKCHTMECLKQKQHRLKNAKCNICSLVFLNDKELHSHMVETHIVRSDQPCLFSIKTCMVCEKKYHHYSTHICPKSSMNATCSHCYIKFATKTLAALHVAMSEKNYKCRICDIVLPRSCMEAEHMLTHTDKYRMAYNCINPQCPPTTLFTDEKSVKMHRWKQHKLKYDRRRTFSRMVIVPDKYVRLDAIQDMYYEAACEVLKSQEADIDADSSQNSQDSQTDSHTDIIIRPIDVNIKQEVEDMDDYCIGDDEQDKEMDEYEMMLSKVFKVTDRVGNHQVDGDTAGPQETVQVKMEPVEYEDFEALIDIQENPITIKEEQIEVDGTCDIDETINISQIKTEPEDDSMTEDYAVQAVYDPPVIRAIKMETEEVEQELLEATDIAIMDKSTEEPTPVKPEQDPPKPNKSPEVPKSQKVSDDKQTPETKYSRVMKKSKETLPKRVKCKEFRQRKIYSCTRCGYANVHKLYRMHVNSKCERTPMSVDSDKFKCTKCNMSFSNLKVYLFHFEKHGYKLLVCPACNLKFESVKELLQHLQKHVRHSFVNFWMIDNKLNVPSKKQHRCQECHELVSHFDFFEHWESHLVLKPTVVKTEPETEIDTEIVKVEVSDKKLLKPAILHMLLQQIRSVPVERECAICFRKFARRNDFKRHLIEHLLMDAYMKRPYTRNKTLRCQICLKEFHKIERYKFHMRGHGGLPVYKCERCDKTFSDSSNFAKHKKIHSVKVLICDICNKKFHAKSQLEKHIMWHQYAEPIKCDRCNMKFFTQSQYKKHMKTRHGHKVNFKCMTCDMYFDSLRKKWDHAWAEHKERKLEVDCPICNMGFRKFQDLKNHAKTCHEMEMSFFKHVTKNGRGLKFKPLCNIKQIETLVVPSDIVDVDTEY